MVKNPKKNPKKNSENDILPNLKVGVSKKKDVVQKSLHLQPKGNSIGFFENKKGSEINKIIYLVPRVVSIVYILFISLFALDTFGEPGMFWPKLLGFIIHLIPSLILLAGLIIAWKNEKLGAYVFLGLFIIMTLFFNTYRQMITFFIISLPVLIISILFYIHYKLKNRNK